MRRACSPSTFLRGILRLLPRWVGMLTAGWLTVLAMRALDRADSGFNILTAWQEAQGLEHLGLIFFGSLQMAGLGLGGYGLWAAHKRWVRITQTREGRLSARLEQCGTLCICLLVFAVPNIDDLRALESHKETIAEAFSMARQQGLLPLAQCLVQLFMAGFLLVGATVGMALSLVFCLAAMGSDICSAGRPSRAADH